MDNETLYNEHQDVVVRLNRDLVKAAKTLSEREAEYLVRSYYQFQHNRLVAENRIRALAKTDKPHEVISWERDQATVIEQQIKKTLDWYTENHRFGAWPRSILGIGPVITAGLIVNTHMDHLVTAGHLWSFAGLNPEKKWNKGEKRPWNASLKVICYHAGECFVRVQNNPKDTYGHMYAEKKKFYIEKNEAGGFAERAAAILTERKFDKTTDAYKAYVVGHLPPAHVHAMARRFAVKMFLSHYWEVCYRLHFEKDPPLPFAIAHLGHVHIVPPRLQGAAQ